MRPPDSLPGSASLIDRVTALVRSRLAAAGPASASPTSYDSLHEAAAVLAWFDPRSLRAPAGTADPAALDELLTHSGPVVAADGTRRWALSPEIRVAVLRQIRERDRVRAAVTANPVRPSDPLQQALDAYLSETGTPVEVQSLGQLNASYQACEWLRAAGFANLPDRDRLLRRIDWLTLLQPFEHIAGEHFRGRTRELATLRTYAEVLPPGSAAEAIGRFVKSAGGLRRRKAPLLVHGPGGVGKSALLARFILEHARAHEKDRFPFVYLDFDRPDVLASEPLTLLVEAVRQLGIEYPDARSRCELVRREWLGLLAQEASLSSPLGSVRTSPVTERFRSSAVYDFASLVESLGAGDRPVLFVLDTFEEVQWRSQEYVTAIWDLLEEMQQVIGRLRICVSGRGEITGHEAIELELKGLGEEASEGYLKMRGVKDPRVARRLARQVGGNPLSLKLAAELFEREGTASGNLGIDAREYLFVRVSDGVIQRQLYRRILGHIHDERIRRLAHPGLVLRRITPDLILQVLAGPCHLDIHSPHEARALFDELQREVALVTVASNGVLEHRPDLRRLMLELLEQDDPQKVRAIRERAVAWYESQPASPADRAEEIYYRLSLGQDGKVIDRRWVPGVERYLVTALPEFHAASKAYLASRLNLEVDEETQRLAEVEDWERIVERRGRDLLAQGQPEEALSLLRQRDDRTVASPVVTLEAAALTVLGRWPKGLEVLDRGVETALGAGARQEVLNLTLQEAELVLTWAAAAPSGRVAWHLPADRLARLNQTALAPTARLNVVAHQLALAREIRPFGLDLAALEDELHRIFDGVPDEMLSDDPVAACWAASVFQGRQDVTRLARVLRVVGWFGADEPALRQAGGWLARLDAQWSAREGEQPGALARAFAVPAVAGNSLTATWSDFLLTAEDHDVRTLLSVLLDQYADVVPPELVAALAIVMRSALSAWTQAPRAPIAVTAGSVPGRRTRSSSPSVQTRRDLADALLSVLASEDSRREFLRGGLGRSYDAMVPSGADPRASVQAVIETAAREGWLDELVSTARQAYPANIALAQAAQQLGLSSGGLADAGFLEESATRSGSDAGISSTRLVAIARQVCAVTGPERLRGTGFLVGADLVLTAAHVLAPESGRELSLRFDIDNRDSRTTSTGWRYRLGDVLWQNTELDYALARVHGSPGVQPIGGWIGPGGSLRHWIDASHPPEIMPGSDLLVVQYDDQDPPRLTVARGNVVTLSSDRVWHTSTTRPGSSGGPCFTRDWELVGLSTGARTKSEVRGAANVGVLLLAVLGDLRDHGFGHLLGTAFL